MMEINQQSNFYLTLQTIKSHIQNILNDIRAPFHTLLYSELTNILGDEFEENMDEISNIDIIQSSQKVYQAHQEALQTIVHLSYKLMDISIEEIQLLTSRQDQYEKELFQHKKHMHDIQKQKNLIQNDISLFKSQLRYAQQTIVEYENSQILNVIPFCEIIQEELSEDLQEQIKVEKLKQEIQNLAQSMKKLQNQIKMHKKQNFRLNHQNLSLMSEIDRNLLETKEIRSQIQKYKMINQQLMQQNIKLKEQIFDLENHINNYDNKNKINQIKLKKESSQTSFDCSSNNKFISFEDKTQQLMIRQTSCTSFNPSNQSRKYLFGDIQIDCSDKNPQNIFNQDLIRKERELYNSKSNKSIKKYLNKQVQSYQNLFIIRQLSRKSIIQHQENYKVIKEIQEKQVNEIGVNTNWEQKIVYGQVAQNKSFWSCNNMLTNIFLLKEKFLKNQEQHNNDSDKLKSSGVLDILHNFIVTKRIRVK